MARNNHITNSFVAGEASPKFLGRTETQQYNQSCEEILNALVHPQGGASRRPGTHFVREILRPNGNPPTNARVIPFLGTDGTRWQLIITPHVPDLPGGYLGGDPLEWQAVNVADHSMNYVRFDYDTTYVAPWLAGYYNLETLGVPLLELQYVQAGDTMFFAHRKMRPFKIVYDPSTTPKFTMKTCPDVTGALLDDREFRMMPFEDPVIQSSLGTKALNLAVSGTGALTVSVPVGSQILMTGDWHGKIIKFTRDSNAVVVVMIYDVDSATSAKAIAIAGVAPAFSTNKNYGSSDPDDYYETGQWDNTKGWPATVTFFESRLVYGGSKSYPDRQWYSEIDDVQEFDFRGLVTDTGFTDPVTASDPFQAPLKSNILSEIRWMSPGKTITIGTNHREFVVQGPDNRASIGPTNYQSSAETPHGSAYVQAARIENTTAFLQRHRRAVRELVYNLDENSFRASNLNIIAEHIVKKSAYRNYAPTFSREEAYLVQIVMQECPDGILWCLDNNGALCALTREREQQVNAWHYHEIAGTSKVPVYVDPDFIDVEYKPQVKSLSVIQKPSIYADGEGGEPDELWLTVSRGVAQDDGGGTDVEYVNRIYLERLAQEWDRETIDGGWNTIQEPYLAPVYMDCAYVTSWVREVVFNGHPNRIIGPLPHGANTTVSIVRNGMYLGERTTDIDGMLDLSADIDATDESWQLIIGFNFTARVVPVTPEVPASTGSSQGLPRRVDQVTAHFYRTTSAFIGRVADTVQANTPAQDLEEIAMPTEENSPLTPLFTGEKKVHFVQGYEDRPKVAIESRKPLPMHVTHLVSRMVVYE